jgi:sigma-E factor negative regulatory protein RseC
MRVRNPIRAQPGDRVVIGVHERGVVRASLLLYMLPLLGLILFAVFGGLVGERFLAVASELPSIIGGLLGLLGGLALVRRGSLSSKTDAACGAVILRRADLPVNFSRRL